MEIEEAKLIYVLTTGSHETIGRRSSMEDKKIILKECAAIIPNTPYNKVFFAGLYDGHGGTHVVEQTVAYLHSHIFNDMIPGNEIECIKQSHLSFDSILKSKNCSGGTCSIVILIIDGILYVANLGDSESILVTDTTFTELTSVHKALTPSEKTRIEDLGGAVFFGRVFGTLEVSRALGDFSFKIPRSKQNFVTAEPSIKMLKMDSTAKFIIMACDGLWDVCKHEKAAELVTNWISQDKSMDECAKLLVQYALDNGSDDNITVIIIKIDFAASEALAIEAEELKTQKKLKEKEGVEANENNLQLLQIIMDPSIPIFLQSVLDVNLQQSYFLLTGIHRPFCADILKITDVPLPCWVSQKLISYKLFGDEGLETLTKIEEAYHDYFLWAPHFSNIHNVFFWQEKPIVVCNKTYTNGPEHFFQRQKSLGTSDEEKVAAVIEKDIANGYYTGRSHAIRKDWEQIKDDVMLLALKAKFIQQKEAQEILLETKNKLLVQIKTNEYWGSGDDGKGKNKLALLLMQVREELMNGTIEDPTKIDMPEHLLPKCPKPTILVENSNTQGTSEPVDNSASQGRSSLQYFDSRNRRSSKF